MNARQRRKQRRARDRAHARIRERVIALEHDKAMSAAYVPEWATPLARVQRIGYVWPTTNTTSAGVYVVTIVKGEGVRTSHPLPRINGR